MIRELIELIQHKLHGDNPLCDYHLDVMKTEWQIGLFDFLFHSKTLKKSYLAINWPILQHWIEYDYRVVYCEWCWNYIHLKKWKCDDCNKKGTIRSRHTTKIFACPKCFKIKKLEVI